MDQNKIDKIQRAIDFSKQLNETQEALCKVGFQFETPAIEVPNFLFGDYLKYVSREVGDACNWLSWFIFENKCGESKLRVTINKKTKKIKTVKDLVWVLESE